MHPAGQRKCPHCEEFFLPDARNRQRQHYCAKPACRRASKAASQRRWLSRPENADYFRGPDNAARVRAWQAAHPGYGKKRRPRAVVALQDDCRPQVAKSQEVTGADDGALLQDDWQRQSPLVIGLIAHLAGVTLQEDIAAMTGQLIAKGQAVLGVVSGAALPRC